MIFDLQDKNGFSLIPNKMLNIPWGGIQPYSYFSGNEQDSFIVIMANDSISNYYLVRAVENNNQIVFSDKDCSTIAFNSDWTIETVFEHSQIDDATIEKILSSYLGVWPEKFRKAISELEEFNLFKAELNKLNEVDLVIDSEWLCKGRVINPCFVRPYQPAGYLEGKTDKLNTIKRLLYEKACKLIMTSLKKQVKVIFKDGKEEDFRLIKPSFIYNRFDLRFGDKRVAVVSIDNDKWIVPLHYKRKTVQVGIIMTLIPKYALEILFRKIFYYFKCKKINYENSFVKIDDNCKEKKQWVLNLDSDLIEFQNRLSKKSRYNLKREYRLMCEQFGNVELVQWKAEETPDWIIETYFRYKEKTYGHRYRMKAKDYIDKYFVTNTYALMDKGRKMVFAVLFSCEQFDNVFLENLAYNPGYESYSFGKQIYNQFLYCLINKGKKQVMLGGGNLAYKKSYGSYCFLTYSGMYYANKVIAFVDKLSNKIKAVFLGFLN